MKREDRIRNNPGKKVFLLLVTLVVVDSSEFVFSEDVV
jgi:hypothetical protein